MLLQLSVFSFLHSTWTNLQLHLEFHRIVIELTKFHGSHNKSLCQITQNPPPPHAFFWLIDFKTQSVGLKAAFSVGIPFLKLSVQWSVCCLYAGVVHSFLVYFGETLNNTYIISLVHNSVIWESGMKLVRKSTTHKQKQTKTIQYNAIQ
jgi:hypothetical protein